MSSNVQAFAKLMEPNEVYDFGWYHPALEPILLKVIPAAKPPVIHLHIAPPTQPETAGKLALPAPAEPAPEKLNSDGSFPLVTGVEILAERSGVRADSGPNGIGYAHFWRVTNTSNKEVFVEGWVFYNF